MKAIWIALIISTLAGSVSHYAASSAEADKAYQEITESVETTEAIESTTESVETTPATVTRSENAAPDFTATLADGSTFTLSEATGKVILVNFWATWCSPCVEEMPAFQKLDEDYGDEVMILAVNCMEDTSIVDSFIKENGYTFPIAYDTDGAIEMNYPVQYIPYTMVIGKNGEVAETFSGSYGMEAQYKTYKTAIDKALEADA